MGKKGKVKYEDKSETQRKIYFRSKKQFCLHFVAATRCR